jgi:hypothetical protein
VNSVAARHAADVSLTEVHVAYYLSDGTTARASYPSTNADPTEAVEALIREKKRAGSGLAVDSLDISGSDGAERFIAQITFVAWVVR